MKLSVIIPVYNTSKYLQKCFDSLIPLMTKLAGEVIFINDGSTDESLQILKQFQSQHSYVQIINQENLGLSGARNTGIHFAKGDYLIFLDSDDWIEATEIEKIYSIAVINNADLVGFRLQFVDEAFKVGALSLKHPISYEKSISGAQALIHGYQPSSACIFMYRTTFLKQNNLTFFQGIMQEDVEFTIRILIPAQNVYFTNIVAYNYYRRSDSMTTTLLKERKERYLADSITVAEQIKMNILHLKSGSETLKIALEKNYNTVIWNLLWRFFTNPTEVSYEFKKKCITDLKAKSLYPMKGSLKSNFQRSTSLLFNAESFFMFILKFRS